MRGKRGAQRPAAASSCSPCPAVQTGGCAQCPTNSPLFFRGGGSVDSIGVIEGPPRVYIVYWGSQWGNAGIRSNGDYTFSNDTAGMAPYQQDFFRGLGTDGETWSGVMTQYCDFVSTGATSCPASNPDHVGYPSGAVLAGVWYDHSAPEPAQTTGNDIANEAIRAAQHFGNAAAGSNLNNQYVITSPPGTDPASVFADGDCAWHSDTTQLPWSGDDVTYTNVPYLPGSAGCSGAGAVNTPGTLDGVSMVGGHEYAETLTDAFGTGGWTGTNGGVDENADKCNWGEFNNAQNGDIKLSTGTFAVMSTWANDGGGNGKCELSHPIVSNPAQNSPGPKILVVGDSISNGVLGDYTWRYRLWQDLSGTNAQFVGHRTGTENIYDDQADLALVSGQTPPTDNYANPTDGYYNNGVESTFSLLGGNNHDALWGWSYALAKNYVAQEVSAYQPNYMLIELGFNDLAFFTSPSATVANAKAMIANARAVDPTIKILIANVVHRTPLPSFPNLNSTIDTYNSDLAAAVPGWSTSQSPVALADISGNYAAAYDTYDGLHPNGVGEYVIADAFATVLANHFGVGTVPGSPPSSVPGITLTTPASLDASISQQGPLLQWSRTYGATGYRVYERDITGNPSPLPAFTELPLPLPGDHWLAGWGTPGHTYQYEVSSARGFTESGTTGPATLTMPNPEPVADAPSKITVTPSNGTTSIALSWTAPTGNANDNSISGYDVFWEDASTSYAGEIPSETFVSGTSLTLTGLTFADTYNIAIASVNASGAGPWGGAPQAIVGDGAPPAPTLSAGPYDTLTWPAEATATGYWIYQAVPGKTPIQWTRLQYEVPAGWNSSLAAGTYSLTAGNGTLESPKSNSVVLPLLSASARAARPAESGRPLNPASWIPAWLRAAPNIPALATFERTA